ncbi:T9SS-dependent choice-of-anchor J family protein [Moheibacter sediminis]|uniref:Por secretion system C-terminal sorting domain-containing protein n=1 Tax=Moheibacter sediminis TaxID=1434700 RepID=A0A1W1Y815_9FLAO|nr:choice-of-anchor J domain-containing protein [Moheibacter sediminis]SMC32296.1 Por secretion system C-terminal sorting domain-containing protein [Moheibacter sediminis]
MRKHLFYLLLSIFPFTGFGQLLNEGFEGSTFPPAGWTTFIGTNGIGTGFNWGRATATPYEGSGYAFVRYENVTGGTAEDWMVTPAIDLSDYENAELTFYTRQDFSANWAGQYYVKVSTTSQVNHAGFADVASWTELTLNATYNVYEQKTVDLSAYDGQTIYIAFVMVNDDGDSWYVDNVVVNADEITGGSEECNVTYDGSLANALGPLSVSIMANDFTVDANTIMNVDRLTLNVIRNIGTADIYLFENNGGSPGTLVASHMGITPTSKTNVGTAFGQNVYEVVIDFPAEPLEGGASGSIYWIGLKVTAGGEGTPIGWEKADANTNAMAHTSVDGGTTWLGSTTQDGAFIISGICEAVETIEGCLDAENGQWPFNTYTPSCIGVIETVTDAAWTGEYSMVQVTAGTEYTFSVSDTSYFITIGDETGTTVLASGTGLVTWAAPADQQVRFYTHFNSDCEWDDETFLIKSVQCGEILPPPANDDCENAIALSCGDSDSGSTLFATDSGGNAAPDVFYTYTGSGTEEMVTVSLCGSEYDTFIRVFSDCTLTEEIAFNDDFCNFQSEVSFMSDGTSTYVILVEGYEGIFGDIESGNFEISVTCESTEPDGCLEAENGQWPFNTYTPSCTGAVETVTGLGWTGEYSMVQATGGTEYIFSVSDTSYFITIGDETGTTVLASGTGSVTWTAPADQLVRFYTHFNSDCEWDDEIILTRSIQCGEILPPPANDDCADAIALSCGDSETGSTTFATDSGGNSAGDVFYTFTGEGEEQLVTVSLCGSGYDTFVRVFSDCTLTNEIAFNDDSCGLQSEVSFVSDGTSTYVIMVEGFASNVGNYIIGLSCEEISEPTDYCEPVLYCTDGDLITNVTFVGIDNDTDCSPNGYGGYTDQIANVEAGNTYPISVTVGSGWGFESVSVWIDYNNNFIFEEDEFTYIGTGSGSDVVGNVVIPAGISDGEYRMRVRVAAVGEGSATWDMACDEDQTFGETEDYTVNVGELGVSGMNSFEFTYYPNPAKDVLNISSEKSVESISIFNLAGQQMINNAKVSNGQVNVSALTPGTYVFRVTFEDGQVETFKIIKK